MARKRPSDTRMPGRPLDAVDRRRVEQLIAVRRLVYERVQELRRNPTLRHETVLLDDNVMLHLDDDITDHEIDRFAGRPLSEVTQFIEKLQRDRRRSRRASRVLDAFPRYCLCRSRKSKSVTTSRTSTGVARSVNAG
jgi:hypothetical protein